MKEAKKTYGILLRILKTEMQLHDAFMVDCRNIIAVRRVRWTSMREQNRGVL